MGRKGVIFLPQAAVAAVVLIAGVTAVAAANQSWTGVSGPFWTDGGNWQSGVAPIPGDNLSFTLGNLNNRSNYNNFASGTTFGNISIFEGSLVQYILAGAPITLTNGIATSGPSFTPPILDLDINLNQVSQAFSATRGLVVNGNVMMSSGASFAAVILYLGGGGTITFNGTITGGFNASIEKTNSGTVVLASGASFQGEAIGVSEGLLRLDGAATNASANCYIACYQRSSPATLQGTGVVDHISLSSSPFTGGILSPGDGGPGIMQCKVADLHGGILAEQVNGPIPGIGYAQLLVSSNCVIALPPTGCSPAGEPAQLVLVVGYAPALGDSFQIIEGPGSGIFANLPQDSIAESTNGYSFAVSYTNGVNLTTVRRPDSPFVLWSGNASYYNFEFVTTYTTNILWSATQNWAGAVAPTSGSRLQFTRLQARTVGDCRFPPPPQTNDLAAGLSLASLLFSDSNYVVYGNAVTVTEGITNHITSGTNSCFLGLVTTGPLVFDGDAGGTFVECGSFNGSGTVRKQGGGNLIYTGTTMNSFVGSVVVDDGALRADGSFTDGSFAVNGGLLTGTGTVSSVTMNGGTLLPGASPGILHVQGSLTMSTSAVFQVDLMGPTPGDGYDQLEVNGTVNLAAATLRVQPGFSITPGTAFLVLVNDSSNPIAGTFAGLPEGAMFQAGGQFFTISYKAGPHANDVLITRVNPPGNLSGIMQISADTVQLQGSGATNVAYTIQANTNLLTTNWMDIGTTTGGSAGVFSFNVTNVLSFPQRFFRVQSP